MLSETPFKVAKIGYTRYNGHEQTALQRQIEATDRQINSLVYELYGLTEVEIAIVEGGVNGGHSGRSH